MKKIVLTLAAFLTISMVSAQVNKDTVATERTTKTTTKNPDGTKSVKKRMKVPQNPIQMPQKTIPQEVLIILKSQRTLP